jgi:hypothetical protein
MAFWTLIELRRLPHDATQVRDHGLLRTSTHHCGDQWDARFCWARRSNIDRANGSGLSNRHTIDGRG